MGRFSIFSRIPGVTLVTIGLIILLVIAISWFQAAYFYEYRMFSDPLVEYMVCRNDGTPLIFKTEQSYYAQTKEERICRNIAGATITLSTSEELSSGEELRRQRSRGGGYWLQRVLQLPADRGRDEVWYLKHDGSADGRAVFQVYSLTTNLSKGFLGSEGFSANPIAYEKHFPMRQLNGNLLPPRVFSPGSLHLWASSMRGRDPLSDRIFIWADDSLYRLDLKDRGIKPVVSWLPDEVVQCVVQTEVPFANDHKQKADRFLLVAKTSKRLIEVDTDGNLKEFPLPDELGRAALLTYYGKTRKGLVLSEEGRYLEEGGKVRQIHTVYTLDDRGNLVSKEEAALLSVLPEVNQELTSTAYYALFGIPGIVMSVLPDVRKGESELLVSREMDLSKDYPLADRILGEKRQIIFNRTLIGIVFILTFALFALLWERRYHGNIISQVVWSIYVLLFGLPGLVGYLTHRKWPVRLPCVHCGTKLPVTSTVCPKCSTPVPPPEHTPREIFA